MISPSLYVHRLPKVFLLEFLPWYCFRKPLSIILLYGKYAKAFAAVFSILFLLKTLFSPWKSIADTYPSNLLQLGRVIQVFTLNCTARSVGAVVRTGAIVFAVVIQILLLAVFMTYLIAWLAFPLLVAIAFRILFLLA